MTYDFQDVEVPRGRFIGWGNKPPQKVTVKVISFDPTGGTDFNGNICPLMLGNLVEACDNYRDKGAVKERLDADELVSVKGATANLKAGLLAADPKPGDVVQMDFTDTYKTSNGTGKTIDVRIARGAGNQQSVSAGDVL